MTEKTEHTIADADDGMRLDRWLHRHWPDRPHSFLAKMIRKGSVRLDGKRCQPGARVLAGQQVRLPRLTENADKTTAQKNQSAVPSRDADDLHRLLADRVIFEDSVLIAFDKPAGLAVQGGSGTRRHVDGVLDRFAGSTGERPKLVHRLDRDTAGVLVVAKTVAAAAFLTDAFRRHTARKLYWAIVAGVPANREGSVDLALAKLGPKGGEKMHPAEDGQRAITRYRTIDSCGQKAAWVAFQPLTGRTHQLRAHAAALGTPILGDGKYGAAAATPAGLEIAKRVHLVARRLILPHPDTHRRDLDLRAPIPAHISQTLDLLGFHAAEPDADEFWAD